MVLAGYGAASAQEAATSIGGTLRDADGEPIEGVRLTAERDGEAAGTATTDQQGNWRIPLPAGGGYTVRLDTETLPEGVELRNPDRNPLETSVRDGQARTVIFPVGEGGSAGRSTLDRALDLAAQGVKLGLIIALAAVGLSMIYGVTGLVNFAHGELVTFGAMVAFLLSTSPAGPGWWLIPGAALAVVAGGALGYGLDAGFFRPLRSRGTGLVALIVVTIGLSLLLRHVMLVIFGGAPRAYADYAIQRAIELGPVSMAPKDLVIVVVAAAVLALVGLLLQRTRLGKGMRAVADDKDLAETAGIDVERVMLTTWVAGAALAALGGVLLGVTEAVSWDMGFRLLLVMFAAVILGGLGTAFGAMAGGLVIGLVSEVSTTWFAVDFKVVFALAVLILTLLFRPQGIFGVRERVG